MHDSSPRNRLAKETSLYLLQHAANPVDWYPWGQEALDLARRLDRPILLSIGYSACHWCHVMERECFENRDIAELMNSLFVCIKVDREERPDLDSLYMKALQGMTARGGWPMTMFLTTDARPFYGGTYFPPEDRGTMPGFPRVLMGVAQTWANKRGEVLESASRMVEYLEDPGRPGSTGHVSDDAFREAAASLVASMDEEHGGFGRAPKFPGTMALGFLMEQGAELPGADRLVRLTLDRMAQGGMRDHLGGGFHRYSVDREWLAPHFEKMLYDQALMAGLYVDAARCFSHAPYAAVAEDVFDYVIREMTAPEGAFYCAQDADSEGVEGRHFLWDESEVREVLGPGLSELACLSWDVSAKGNFEGANILRRTRSLEELARLTGRTPDAVEKDLEDARSLLLARRRQRPAPATDRKILTDWNSLMISAMARGGAFLGREDLVEAALRAQRFLQDECWNGQELFHVHAGGLAKVPGFLDDHAFFGLACLDLFAVAPSRNLLDMAVWCANRLLEVFADGKSGGFHFSASSGEALVARTGELHDGAVPSGNSVATELLLRLWMLTGEDRYRIAADAVMKRFLGDALRQPYGCARLLAVAAQHARGQSLVVVSGTGPTLVELVRAALSSYRPGMTVIAQAPEEGAWVPSALRGKDDMEGPARAYVCEGTTCGLPIARADELFRELHRGRRLVGEEGR